MSLAVWKFVRFYENKAVKCVAKYKQKENTVYNYEKKIDEFNSFIK